MKTLIVNADDFGASHGINVGVIEGHRRGILTSTSMMVDRPASEAAAGLSARHPSLGVGLHVELPSPGDSLAAEREIERQLRRFTQLTGRRPSHIDAHHNVQREEHMRDAFIAVAERHTLPLRDHCGVRHIASFWGQRAGASELDQVSPTALARILSTEIEEGLNELGCHPGYVDDGL